MANHGELVVPADGPDGCVPSRRALDPCARAQISACDVQQRSPNADRPAWSRINGAKMSPFFAKKQTTRYTDCFLAFANIDAASNQAAR